MCVCRRDGSRCALVVITILCLLFVVCCFLCSAVVVVLFFAVVVLFIVLFIVSAVVLLFCFWLLFSVLLDQNTSPATCRAGQARCTVQCRRAPVPPSSIPAIPHTRLPAACRTFSARTTPQTPTRTTPCRRPGGTSARDSCGHSRCPGRSALRPHTGYTPHEAHTLSTRCTLVGPAEYSVVAYWRTLATCRRTRLAETPLFARASMSARMLQLFVWACTAAQMLQLFDRASKSARASNPSRHGCRARYISALCFALAQSTNIAVAVVAVVAVVAANIAVAVVAFAVVVVCMPWQYCISSPVARRDTSTGTPCYTVPGRA